MLALHVQSVISCPKYPQIPTPSRVVGQKGAGSQAGKRPLVDGMTRSHMMVRGEHRERVESILSSLPRALCSFLLLQLEYLPRRGLREVSINLVLGAHGSPSS